MAALPTSVPAGQAAYWLGANGNAYLAGAHGGNTTYANPTNISAQGFSGLNNGQGQDVQATQIANPNPPAPTGGSAGGGGGSSSTFNSPGYLQGIQQEYGAQINAGPQNLSILQQGQQGGINAANTNAAAQGATYQTQANAQDATLQNAIGSQQNQQHLSLAELADQIRGQHSGLQAQLGAVGAGSSSASGMGDQALAHEQNTQTANIDQQANSNISGAQTQIKGVDAVLGANLNQLNTFKQNQINQITNQYAQLMTQLQTSLQTAQGEEKARLAEFGQQLTGSAIQSLTNLNGQIQGQAQGLIDQGNQHATGLQDIPQAQAVAPITTQALSPFSNNVQPGSQSNASAVPGGLTLSDILKQQQNQ
jgi:hypothetical protein